MQFFRFFIKASVVLFLACVISSGCSGTQAEVHGQYDVSGGYTHR